MLNLRKIDYSDFILNVMQARLIANGMSAYAEKPALEGVWVNFVDENNDWSVWFFLDDLVEYVMPHYSGVVLTEKLKLRFIDLINRNTPLFLQQFSDLPAGMMHYEKFCRTADADFNKMLRVTSNQITYWVEKIPLRLQTQSLDTGEFERLSWPVSFKLGSTPMALLSLYGISPGDFLLIKTISAQVMIYGKNIIQLKEHGGLQMSDGFFDFDSIAEREGFSDYMPGYQPHHEDDETTEEMVPENEIPEEIQDEHHEDAISYDAIPVQLEFIIHNAIYTLQEIKELGITKHFTLPAGAEKKVIIQINGQRIGCGELVQIDDNLALEVTDWNLRKKDE